MGFSRLLEFKPSTSNKKEEKWLVQSKPLGNPLEAKHQGSSSQPKLQENLRLLLVELRSHTVTGLEQELFVRSEDTKNLLNCCCASYPSNVWFEKSHKISRQISDSNPALSWLCKKLLSLFGWIDGGYEFVRNPCQTSDNNAKGHTVGPSHSWRKSIKISYQCFTEGPFQDHIC